MKKENEKRELGLNQIFVQNYSISDPGYKYLLAICAKSVNPARIFKCWSGYKYFACTVPLANM